MVSILVHGLRAGADGFVHLTTDQTIAIYCVHMRRHMYLRYAAIALFRVDGATICVKPCDENALFVADCSPYRGYPQGEGEICNDHPGSAGAILTAHCLRQLVERGKILVFEPKELRRGLIMHNLDFGNIVAERWRGSIISEGYACPTDHAYAARVG